MKGTMSDIESVLRGLTCNDVDHDAETVEWVFRFGFGTALRVAAPWRIIAFGGIALGYEDGGQQFGLPKPVDAIAKSRELLCGRAVEAFTVADVTADAAIRLEGGVRVEIFNSSSGYEGWVLHAPGGRTIVAQGGGRVVDFPAVTPAR